MIKNRMKKYQYHIYLGILLLAISILGIYYLQLKSGYYVDEGMTFFLANGQYTGAVTTETEYEFTDFVKQFILKDNLVDTIQNVFSMIQEISKAGNYSEEGTVAWYDAARNMLQGSSTWIDGSDLFEQLTTTQEDRYNYIQVYLNQVVDVHPPLYYFAVHTIFSIFTGTFSNFYLFGINLVFLLSTCIVLYNIIEQFAKDKKSALLAVGLYGFSQGFFSCAMYFRMYAMETFCIILTLYIHLLLKKKQWKLSKKDNIFLIVTIILGFGTHYYYILYLFPLFGVTCFDFWKTKNKIGFITYLRSVVTAGILSIIWWPFSLYHIFFGYRGTEAISNFNFNGLWNKILSYGKVFLHAIFIDNKCLFFLLLIASIYYKVIRYAHREDNVISESACWLEKNRLELYIPIIFYAIIVSKIAPIVADRYIMGLLPLLFLILAIILVNLIQMNIKSKYIQNVVVLVLGICYAIVTFFFTKPDYLYLNQKDSKLEISCEKKDLNCLMVSDDDYRGFPEALKLSEFNQIMVVEIDDIMLLETNFPDDNALGMIVYIFNGLEEEKILNDVGDMLSLSISQSEKIQSDIEGFSAYYIK